MENKILEFVREFNSKIDITNQYCGLHYINDGFTEVVVFPEIILFNDDNDSKEFITQQSLAHLSKALSEVQTIVDEMLSQEIGEFVADNRRRLLAIFPKAKMELQHVAKCRRRIIVSGEYDEESNDLDTFMDILKEDFEYIFDGFTLDTEW